MNVYYPFPREHEFPHFSNDELLSSAAILPACEKSPESGPPVSTTKFTHFPPTTTTNLPSLVFAIITHTDYPDSHQSYITPHGIMLPIQVDTTRDLK